MAAPRILAPSLVLLCLALPNAAASSATATDPAGDAAPHLDILQIDLSSSGGSLTVTLTLDDLDAAQTAGIYTAYLYTEDRAIDWDCNLAGDGVGLVGSCSIEAFTPGLQEDEAWLRAAPHGLGNALAPVFGSLVWANVETLTGSWAPAPASFAYDTATDTVGFTAAAADLGLSSGDVLTLDFGGTGDCSIPACPTTDNIYGASITIE